MANGRRSVAAIARREKAADAKLRENMQKTLDSFTNFAQMLGVGADNALSTAGYGFNPVTRIRTMLEWIHRGSWLGGIAVDVVADDMTRAGVELGGNVKPEDIEKIEEACVSLNIWNSINETIKWARLYGGAIGVLMVDGQKTDTPLRLETIDKGQFQGLMVLDRWMVDPDMSRLVTRPGPDQGLPQFYTTLATGPALPHMRIHHSRCLRLIGIKLPYWQRIQEQMWGISVIERIYDRMIAFDSATTGAAQLVYKAYLRTYSIEGLREIIAAGGPPFQALVKQVDLMRRMASQEGITLLDAKDKMETMQHTAFSGLSDALIQFGQQLSGALQIPLVRLFGQSPAGLNATGESDMRMYYDGIKQQQERDLHVPVTWIYRAVAQSNGIQLPGGFNVKFRNLWQLTDTQKAETAETVQRAVVAAEEAGLISPKTAMEELRQSSSITGVFSNITDEDINAADDVPAPAAEVALGEAHALSKETGQELPAAGENGEKKKAKDSIAAVTAMKQHHDLDTVIENPKGSIRRGNGGGKAWEVAVPYDYGYLRKTKAPDGEPLDCMIGPNRDSKDVWIIDQVKLDTGAPDEPKVMLGYRSLHEALSDFLQGYSDGRGWDRIGATHKMGMDEFKSTYLPKYSA